MARWFGLNHLTMPGVMTYFRLSHPDHAPRRRAWPLAGP
jgi:hypothetical protein